MAILAVFLADLGKRAFRMAATMLFRMHSQAAVVLLSGSSLTRCRYGGVAILDQTYKQVYNVCVADFPIMKIPDTVQSQPCVLDFHESRVTSRNTILATVRNVRAMDLTPYGGPKNGWILDSVFVEVDPVTDKVVFSWSPADHIHQLDTLAIAAKVKPIGNKNTAKNPWDWYV